MSENEAQTCPKCGVPTKEGDVFCRACGTKHLTSANGIKPPAEAKRVCQNCGNTLRPAARFCDLCGEECVRMRRERGGGKRRRSGCLVILAAVLLWLAAGVSAIAIYEVSRDMSFKEILASIRGGSPSVPEDKGAGEKLSDIPSVPKHAEAVSEDEGLEEKPDENSGAVVSDDSYETVIPRGSLPIAMPLAEDETNETNMPLPDLQEGPKFPENTDENSRPDESDDGAESVENTPSVEERSEVIVVSPSNASAKNEDDAVSSEDGRRDSGVWSGQDSEGYSTVSANDRFFTSSQTPSLRGIVTADKVRVRSAPNTDSRIKRQLDSGAEVELIRRFSPGKEQYYWFEVRDSNGSGWIYGEFIKPEAGSNKK
jgi:hypothetical protein